MKIHYHINVYAGKRTETSVEAYSTAVNPREFRFDNGATVTESEIARFIESALTEAIEKIKNAPRSKKDGN